MAKNEWAKGRQTGIKSMRVDIEAHELATELARAHKCTIKDLVYSALLQYRQKEKLTS